MYTEVGKRKVRGASSEMLSDEKLKDIEGLQRGRNYIEVTCGCTSRRLGDSVGKLKVFTSGQFLIACHCSVDCNEGKYFHSLIFL